MMFLNFLKVNNNPIGLDPENLSFGKFLGIEVFVCLKESKRRENSSLKEEYPRQPWAGSFPVRQRMRRAKFRAPSFPLWGKVGVWQPWLQCGFFAGCSRD